MRVLAGVILIVAAAVTVLSDAALAIAIRMAAVAAGGALVLLGLE